MTNLEPVLGGDDTIRRNFSKLEDLYTRLATLEAMLNGKTTRGGSSSVTWPGGSPNTNNTTVAHGLGATPSDVEVANVATTNMVLQIVSSDGTNIVFAATTRDGTSPAAATQRFFYWRAWA